jgi:hypothetical protein
MRGTVPEDHPLRRMFAALTEHAFVVRLGVADPRLVDYLADLLSRFLHVDQIFSVRNVIGKRLEEVAEMLAEAEGRIANARRETHRHIGDFTLFWTGVYPEALPRFRSSLRKDHFVDYCEQGKRSYYIASTFENEPFQNEAPVLRRLSHEFEMCAFGLSQVRTEWEKLESDGAREARHRLLD